MTNEHAGRSVTRLAVLGSPIEHSKSPVLHGAAYRALGLDWHYDALEVNEAGLADVLAARGPGWRGMSLTMPLKSVVIPMCRSIDETARRTGAVNTIVFDSPTPGAPFDGYNTDVEGIVRAIDETGTRIDRVELLGAGNTASSVVLAIAQLGASDVVFRARSLERAKPTAEFAASLGLRVDVVELGAPAPHSDVDLVANTIPDGRALRVEYPAAIRRDATLLDVVYDPWPTALAAHWAEAGGTVVSGLDMLLHQAVAQVRLFARADGEGDSVASDSDILAAMRDALRASASPRS